MFYISGLIWPIRFPSWSPSIGLLQAVLALRLLIYERENKPCFSLEVSHIQFINYSLHIVDIFNISCHEISIVITSLVTARTHTFTAIRCVLLYC
jgi:hypothetical protein